MKVPNSKEEITLEWLNEILSLSLKGIKVLAFHWDGPANNGFGCLSSLERLNLKVVHSSGQTSNLSIILKSLPTDPAMRKYVIEDNFCKRELAAYTEIFPAWNAFLEKRNVPPEFRCTLPSCYYGAQKGRSCEDWTFVLFLEDVIASGFQMWSGGFASSLEWKQAQPIVKQMALFHATGLAYSKANGISYQDEYSCLILKCDLKIDYYIQSGFDSTIKFLKEERDKKHVQIPDGIFKVLESIRGKFSQQVFAELRSMNEKKSSTICHNDFHVNNMMFTRDYEGAVLFDFQALLLAPPMKDLSFFLILNCDKSLISSDRPKVLEYYHKIFQQAIQAMGVDMEEYNLDRINQEYKEMAYLSLLHVITGAPGWCFGPGTSEDTRNRFRNAIVQMYEEGILQQNELS